MERLPYFFIYCGIEIQCWWPYLMNLPILLSLGFVRQPKKLPLLAARSQDQYTSIARPITSSRGTTPQYRLSRLWFLLSPRTK